ncbi:MAG: ROK family protein, partial [Thermoplasmata archaeon]
MARRTAKGPQSIVVGVDIGATKIAAAIVSPRGRVGDETVRNRRETDGPEAVVATIVEATRTTLSKMRGAQLAAIGVGIAGQVEAESGLIHYSPNLRWENFPLGDQLRAAFDAQVMVANDVHAALVGEWRHGAGIGELDLFMLVVGTGVGGGAIVGGRLLTGSTNTFGEVGHLTLVAGGRPCHCPNRGCFEAYVGGWAVAERARELVARELEAAEWLVQRAGSIDLITAQTVTQAYREGDPLVATLVRETIDYLEAGVVGIVNTFNPHRVILDGGMIQGLPDVVPGIQEAIRRRCQPAAAFVEVVRARLGEHAAIVGAASLARER